ncbi:helix-turn-helix transcriptional regulator [Rossellomorea sp. NPDC071047]|jgi:putative transcriptional regulator|uniref:helix-turn-helix transcriptional regulator n=1 Tax=Rossellomorea sp. NPDC071047 TaxID=3390675 RepID=UPI003D077EE0
MQEESKILLNRIAVLRAENKLTQKALAEKVDVSRQTIISLEKGKYKPSLTLAFELASVFNVTVEEVFQYVKKDQEEGNE